MTQLTDLVDLNKLNALIADKRIAVQVHPALPLRIYNYTNRAQFANEWTTEERVCRGLIVDENDKVIARGPSKFFNYGQPGAPEASMDTLVRVTKKADGSLGIFWTYDGEIGMATRGSFASDQALHASRLLQSVEYSHVVDEAVSYSGSKTLVAEIIYPQNRIVLSYGEQDFLFSLGYVNNASGIIVDRPAAIDFS